ncbi:MAG: T9SS type A sorting domain-containing protein [Flavobacteriales bacterium]
MHHTHTSAVHRDRIVIGSRIVVITSITNKKTSAIVNIGLRIKIVDMNGKRVLSESPLTSNVTLNVSSLAAGQYFVEVKTASATRRVQVQILR